MNVIKGIGRTVLLRWRTRAETARHRRAHVGEHSLLAKTAQVYGWKDVRIGNNSVICDDTLINALNCPGETPSVVIGDHCFIGRRNFLNAGESLILGDYCLTGTDCHFLGSDHAHESPFVPYIAAGSTRGGSIRLGPNCWLGARVTILKGVSIGFGSIVGAAAVVTRNAPPFSMLVGNPARLIKRFDISRGAWVKADDFPGDGEAQFPAEQEYLAQLRSTHRFVRLPASAIGREFGDV